MWLDCSEGVERRRRTWPGNLGGGGVGRILAPNPIVFTEEGGTLFQKVIGNLASWVIGVVERG